MYMMQDAHSDFFAAAYFLMLVMFGSFFLLNVVLGVVWDAFQENQSTMDEDGDGIADRDERLHEAITAEEDEEDLSDILGEDFNTGEDTQALLEGKCFLIRWANMIVRREEFQSFIMLMI